MFQELLAKRNSAMFNAGMIYFCRELGLTAEEQNLITLQEVSRLEKGTYGTCGGTYTKDGELMRVEIKILTNASIIGMLDVLAHELVHARQHVRNEFTFETIEHKIFFGLLTVNVKEKFHKGQRLLTTPYYERHCEIEAHELAHKLTTGFCAVVTESAAKAKEVIDESERELRDTGVTEEGPVPCS